MGLAVRLSYDGAMLRCIRAGMFYLHRRNHNKSSSARPLALGEIVTYTFHPNRYPNESRPPHFFETEDGYSVASYSEHFHSSLSLLTPLEQLAQQAEDGYIEGEEKSTNET